MIDWSVNCAISKINGKNRQNGGKLLVWLYLGKKTMHPVPDHLRHQTLVTGQRRDLPASTSEKQIFYHLGVGQVFFNREKRCLYLSDLNQTHVLSVLAQLCTNTAHRYVLEPLYLDVHQYFFGGYRLELTEPLCKPLLVALRLKGVMISYALEESAPAKPPSPDNPLG